MQGIKMEIKYSPQFVRQYRKSSYKIKKAFEERRKLFGTNPENPLLRNHALTGDYKGYRSINITGDWRAIFSEYRDNTGEKVIVFEMIGTHSQLYK